MVVVWITCAVVLLTSGAEMLHVRRVRRLAPLAFGPSGRPAIWTHAAPLLRIAAVTSVCWGLLTLLQIAPKVHEAEMVPDGEKKHIVLVLDVSPSMWLEDAGPENKLSRMHRAAAVLESYFKRVTIEQYRVSVVAFYTGAKPVVIETSDIEVVRHILTNLPMYQAFESGKTEMFSGLEYAAEIARPWNPRSTTLIVVSDGDTVPATGMPQMPQSVSGVLVVGVGDPVTGKFIDGHQSRQDASTLRQVALRLGGHYHNANEKHLSTTLVKKLSASEPKSLFDQLTRREYALLACCLGASVLALLPILLHFAGTSWRPGVMPSRAVHNGAVVSLKPEVIGT